MQSADRPRPPALRLLLSLLVAASLIAAACASDAPQRRADDTQANQATEQAAPAAMPVAPDAGAAPAETPAPAAAISSPERNVEPGEAGALVDQAYRELSARLFREVRPSDLLTAAWRGVRDESRREGGLGAGQLQSHIDAGSADIDAFVREFNLYLVGPGAGLDSGKLAQSAIRAMTAAVGDSHTRYAPPTQAQFQQRSDGSYDGIGVVTGNPAQETGPGLVIREVYAGSPADQAGLKAGDRIVRVNGADVSKLPQAEVSGQIRGEPGTPVTLTLQDAKGIQRDVTVTRARVLPPVVASRMVEDAIGYLKIASFPRRSPGRDAAADFEAAMLALQAAGAKALVLDLRDNPGGDPFTSVDVASNFTQDGPIFISIDRDGRRTLYRANTRRTLAAVPTVVLINGNSASGAEVVASALSEYGAAYLIGTTSCGCLSVGQPLKLDDKSEIVVTVQQAITGKLERSLEGSGIEPDEIVRSSRDADTQLARAIEYLQAKLGS
jgi:carboxyl-terminal processing protease